MDVLPAALRRTASHVSSLLRPRDEHRLRRNGCTSSAKPCPILLADEIDAALDVEKVRNLSKFLAELTAEKPIQVLIITHKQDIIVEIRRVVHVVGTMQPNHRDVLLKQQHAHHHRLERSTVSKCRCLISPSLFVSSRIAASPASVHTSLISAPTTHSPLLLPPLIPSVCSATHRASTPSTGIPRVSTRTISSRSASVGFPSYLSPPRLSYEHMRSQSSRTRHGVVQLVQLVHQPHHRHASIRLRFRSSSLSRRPRRPAPSAASSPHVRGSLRRSLRRSDCVAPPAPPAGRTRRRREPRCAPARTRGECSTPFRKRTSRRARDSPRTRSSFPARP